MSIQLVLTKDTVVTEIVFNGLQEANMYVNQFVDKIVSGKKWQFNLIDDPVVYEIIKQNGESLKGSPHYLYHSK